MDRARRFKVFTVRKGARRLSGVGIAANPADGSRLTRKLLASVSPQELSSRPPGPALISIDCREEYYVVHGK